MTPETRASKIATTWWNRTPSSETIFEDLIVQAIQEAVADERLSCAAIAEAHALVHGPESGGRAIAATIRTRGEVVE